MTTALTLTEIKEVSTTLSASKLMPEALQKSPADIFAIVLTGQELGLEPMKAIRGIAIIKGKPTLSADLMGALVKQESRICEYLRLVESTDKVATYETKRVGEPGTTKISFTSEDAQRAGLQGDNWRKYPAQMLRARALSGICRAVYPDLLLGVYSEGDLEEPREEKRMEMVAAFTAPNPIVDAAAKRVDVVEAELKAPSPTPPPSPAKTDAEKKASILKLLEVPTTHGALMAAAARWRDLVMELPDADRAEVRAFVSKRQDELKAVAP